MSRLEDGTLSLTVEADRKKIESEFQGAIKN